MEGTASDKDTLVGKNYRLLIHIMGDAAPDNDVGMRRRRVRGGWGAPARARRRPLADAAFVNSTV